MAVRVYLKQAWNLMKQNPLFSTLYICLLYTSFFHIVVVYEFNLHRKGRAFLITSKWQYCRITYQFFPICSFLNCTALCPVMFLKKRLKEA